MIGRHCLLFGIHAVYKYHTLNRIHHHCFISLPSFDIQIAFFFCFFFAFLCFDTNKLCLMFSFSIRFRKNKIFHLDFFPSAEIKRFMTCTPCFVLSAFIRPPIAIIMFMFMFMFIFIFIFAFCLFVNKNGIKIVLDSICRRFTYCNHIFFF